MAVMENTILDNRTTDTQPVDRQPTLDNCDAVIIGLGARRFVIVEHDETNRLYPVARTGIRELKPGDEVIYQGSQETILAIDVYR